MPPVARSWPLGSSVDGQAIIRSGRRRGKGQPTQVGWGIDGPGAAWCNIGQPSAIFGVGQDCYKVPSTNFINGRNEDCNPAVIVIVDNYDSFTYNLVQRLGEIDATVDLKVVRNDQATVDQIEAWQPSHLIISPGPCTPNEAGISVECARHFVGKLPLLGVCLGHQSIGQASGGKIVRASRLMHGKVDRIHHDDRGLFEGLPNPLEATRYHSLVIDPPTLSDEFEVSAWCDEPDGTRTIMGIRHREHPVFGLQFHPESFLTHDGTELLRRFITVTTAARS